MKHCTRIAYTICCMKLNCSFSGHSCVLFYEHNQTDRSSTAHEYIVSINLGNDSFLCDFIQFFVFFSLFHNSEQRISFITNTQSHRKTPSVAVSLNAMASTHSLNYKPSTMTRITININVRVSHPICSFKHNASFVARLPTIRRHKSQSLHSPGNQKPPAGSMRGRSSARTMNDMNSSVENLGTRTTATETYQLNDDSVQMNVLDNSVSPISRRYSCFTLLYRFFVQIRI